MAQKTGITVNPETVRLHLRAAGITLPRCMPTHASTLALHSCKEDAATTEKSRLNTPDSEKRTLNIYQ